MLKKKNIAMAMAAATVVTAAPAYAAPVQREVVDNTQEKEIKELKAEVLEKFNTKYTENQALANNEVKGKNAYTIKMSINKEEAVTMNSYAEFERAFDKAFKELKNGEKITVEYASEAIRTLEDGTVVDYKEKKDDLTVYNGIDNINNNKTFVKALGEKLGKKAVEGELADGTKYINVPTTEGYIQLKDGDVVLDLDKPIFKVEGGNYVDKNGNAIKAFDEKSVVTDAETVFAKGGVIEGYYEYRNIETKKADSDSGKVAIVKNATAAQKENVTVADLYEASTARLTKKGNELRKAIIDTTKKANQAEKDFLVKSTVYGLDKSGELVEKDDLENRKNELAEIKVVFEERKNEISEWVPVYEMTITEVRNHEFMEVVDHIVRNTDTEVDVAAGLDRYQTSVELSKQGWNTEKSKAVYSDAVVLVSGANDKLVDGLTATPLAAQLDAPVLLTQKDTVPADVLAEIERLGAKDVYIVGGESAVSKEVSELLTKKYSLNVERLSGGSRYETSMVVAEALLEKQGEGAKYNQIFVVGGKGEADALSISAVAGARKTPVLLTPAGDLDKSVEGFLKANLLDNSKDNQNNDYTDIFVVGGESSVSKKVQSQLANIPGTDFEVKRLSGTDRQETNAAVISEFANLDKSLTDGKILDKVVIGKSNNAALVDSLSAGAYAAKTGSHIVLATNELTDSQEDALDKLKDAKTKIEKKTQAGYGIAEKVAKFIKGL